jgi:hypothetical protein
MIPAGLGGLVLSIGVCTFGQLFSYEADSFPTAAGWQIGQNWCDPLEWVDSGKFVQQVELCPGYPPPGGQQSSFIRSLEEFVGVDPFFLEWRMETNGDQSELLWGGPADISVWSYGGVNYRFSISGDQADMTRDNTLPIPVANYEPGVHTFRLELFDSTLYVWYVDGDIIDQGQPEGAFPSFTPAITFRTKAAFLPNTTVWDYIRYGRMPDDGSGDFDSDGDLDDEDLYFVQECAGMPGEDAGPGCRFADFDGDSDVDLVDLAQFQAGFTGGE